MAMNRKFLITVLLSFVVGFLGSLIFFFYKLIFAARSQSQSDVMCQPKNKKQPLCYSILVNKPTRSEKRWQITGILLPVVVTICTTIFSIVILYRANLLMAQSNEIARRTISPHFTVTESVENMNDDWMFTNKVLRISNQEGRFSNFSATVRTYIPLIISGNVYMIPLRGFYPSQWFYSTFSNDVYGDVVKEFSNPNNNLRAANMIIYVNDRLMNSNLLGHFSPPITFVEITFQNIFGEIEIQYFEARFNNGIRLDNEVGARYIHNFSSLYIFNDEEYNLTLDSMTTDLLFLFATTDLRNSFCLRLIHTS